MEDGQRPCNPGMGRLMKLQAGDVVRLAESVTQAEFGLALCDDDGVGVEIDGVIIKVIPHMVNVY